MGKTEKKRKKGSFLSRMSIKTKSIITASVFLLAVLTVILCAADGMFVFKPGSVQANDNVAPVILTETPKTDDGAEPASEQHSVLVSAGNGGTVYPSGNLYAEDWGSIEISVAPDSGYKIKAITVDGVIVGAMSYYTLANITEDHSVLVTFEEIEKPPVPTDTPEVKPTENVVEDPPEENNGESTGGSDSMSNFGTLMDEFFSIFGH